MAFGEIGKIVKNVGSGIFNRTLGRLLGCRYFHGQQIVQCQGQVVRRSDKKDWRVRLQIPTGPLTKFFDLDNNRYCYHCRNHVAYFGH